ncbi:hypothetical protein [Natronospora cellulosivora (SeqCode)]
MLFITINILQLLMKFLYGIKLIQKDKLLTIIFVLEEALRAKEMGMLERHHGFSGVPRVTIIEFFSKKL